MTNEPNPIRKSRLWIGIALGVIILIAAAIRFRLLGIPFERDEGEYAYMGQLLLHGIPPYQEAYNMKLPGIYAFYALILAIFGQTVQAVHLGLLCVNAATIILVFFLAKRLADASTALAAAGAFALLSLGQSVLGFTANAEHFVLLPAMGGLLLMLGALQDQRKFHSRIFPAAILLGIGFVIKQHGVAFIALAAVMLLYHFFRTKPLKAAHALTSAGIFILGSALPFALTCLLMKWAGVFEKFWFWTFTYAQKYAAAIPLDTVPNILKIQLPRILGSAWLLWFLAAVGLLTAWVHSHKHKFFVTAFAVFSFVAVSFGFYYRPHYFIFILPAAALLAAVGFGNFVSLLQAVFPSRFKRVLPIVAAVLAVGLTLYQQFDYFFRATPDQIARSAYGSNPFPESLPIARYIRQNSQPDDRIAVIGSEPQIYFYSQRRSATSYIYTYALMEEHPFAAEMQDEMIRQIEAAEPRYLLFVNVSTSWLKRQKSHTRIFTWFQQYAGSFYHPVGIIDILGPETTEYRWDQDAVNYKPRSTFNVFVFARNTNAAGVSK
jgi:hypothetical protein